MVSVVTDITSGTNPIKFTIDPNSLNDGTHTVRVDMIIDSHSGSLVNQLGGERFEVVTGFDVIVDRNLPDSNHPGQLLKTATLLCAGYHHLKKILTPDPQLPVRQSCIGSGPDQQLFLRTPLPY